MPILEVDEHGFIGLPYIPTISKAMEEILPLLEPQAKIDGIAEFPLYDMDGFTFLAPWDWKEFFTYLSWSGIETTEYFDTLIDDESLYESFYLAYNRYSIFKSLNNENRFSTIPSE